MAIFGNKETSAAAPPAPSSTVTGPEGGRVSRIGEGITIRGKIEGTENLRLEGRLEGEVDLRADLVIGPRAEVRATVHARNITVEGNVDGNLSADQKVELVRTARVQGTIRSPRISVAEGARFEGKIDMSSKGSGEPD